MAKHISLVGMMGSGKSTVAPLVADALGRNVIEVDALIEEREKMPIGEIFIAKGEAYFRKVESALIEHPAVIEAAVIGKPDAERTEIVKAHVVLHAGFAPTDALAEELRQFVKHRLSAHAYPREIVFTEQLPKTPSGKIQRFILRNLEKDESK